MLVPGNHTTAARLFGSPPQEGRTFTHSVVGGDEVVGCRLIDMVLGDYRDGFDLLLIVH